MKVRGIVRDKRNNEPIFGANVFVSDSTGKLLSPPNGSATDPDGNYELENIGNVGYISVSNIGYKTNTRRINTPTEFKDINFYFSLEPKSEQLPEFEVIEEIPLMRKKKNLKPLIIGGSVILVLIGGYITYKKITI